MLEPHDHRPSQPAVEELGSAVDVGDSRGAAEDDMAPPEAIDSWAVNLNFLAVGHSGASQICKKRNFDSLFEPQRKPTEGHRD